MTAVDDFIANIRAFRYTADSGPMVGDIDLFVAALQQLSGGAAVAPTAFQPVATSLPINTPTVAPDATGDNLVFSTPTAGVTIPVTTDGVNFVETVVPTQTQAITDATKSPAATVANSNYDVVIWDDAGTVRATRTAAWTSDATRGTGVGTPELTKVGGVLVNKYDILHGPLALKGTFFATVRTTSANKLDGAQLPKPPFVAPSYSTWNANDAWLEALFLHPDLMTVTGGTGAGYSGSIRGTLSHNSGKFYFEFLCSGIASNNSPCVGVGSSAAGLSTLAGFDANAWTMFMNGTNYHNNVFGAVDTPYVIGDVLGCAVDFTAVTGSVKFYRNGVVQATPYTGLSLGTMYPMLGLSYSTGAINQQGKGTLRVTQAQCSYAPPAGYSYWG